MWQVLQTLELGSCSTHCSQARPNRTQARAGTKAQGQAAAWLARRSSPQILAAAQQHAWRACLALHGALAAAAPPPLPQARPHQPLRRLQQHGGGGPAAAAELGGEAIGIGVAAALPLQVRALQLEVEQVESLGHEHVPQAVEQPVVVCERRAGRAAATVRKCTSWRAVAWKRGRAAAAC